MADGADWELVDFTDRIDRWVRDDLPSQDLRLLVLSFVLSRAADPYRGMRRSPDGPNLWFCQVPDSADPSGRAVLLSFRIDDAGRRVVCDGLATLSLPF